MIETALLAVVSTWLVILTIAVMRLFEMVADVARLSRLWGKAHVIARHGYQPDHSTLYDQDANV